MASGVSGTMTTSTSSSSNTTKPQVRFADQQQSSTSSSSSAGLYKIYFVFDFNNDSLALTANDIALNVNRPNLPGATTTTDIRLQGLFSLFFVVFEKLNDI